jgi:hypothetical protein
VERQNKEGEKMKIQSPKYYWESDCGHKGIVHTHKMSMAGQVRAAVDAHHSKYPSCDMVDIFRFETKQEKELREMRSRKHAGVF